MKLFRLIFVFFLLISVIGCNPSVNKDMNSEASAADTISLGSAADTVQKPIINDSELRPLVKDTFDIGESNLVLSVTPVGKRIAKFKSDDEIFYKTYIFKPGDSSAIIVAYVTMGSIRTNADTILYDRIKGDIGNIIHSEGYIEDGLYGRKDTYRGKSVTVKAVWITEKYRALADSILDNVEFIPNPRKATPHESQEVYK